MDPKCKRLMEILELIEKRGKEKDKLEWEKARLLEEVEKSYGLESVTAEVLGEYARLKGEEAEGLRKEMEELVNGVWEKYKHLL